MSDFTTTNNITSPMITGFAKESATNAVNQLITVLTDNGDITFGAMGVNTPSSALMELDHIMIRPLVEKSFKHYKPLVLSSEFIVQLNEKVELFVNRISSLPLKEQATWWSLMFRYVFYVRNLHGEGKRERLLFYYLLEKINEYYPKTVQALVPLIPDFGYFGDFDHIITISKNEGLINACIKCYEMHLNADCMQVYGKPLKQVTLDEAKAYNIKLKGMTTEEIKVVMKGKKMSLAAKWFKREGHKDSDHRLRFLQHIYPEINLGDKIVKKKRTQYANMRFRHIITSLTQLLQVGEQMMCAIVKTTDIRDWANINMESAPAGFVTKYRKALLNESLDGVEERSKRADRIKCRENTLAAALNGKLNGANSDLSKLSEIKIGRAHV